MVKCNTPQHLKTSLWSLVDSNTEKKDLKGRLTQKWKSFSQRHVTSTHMTFFLLQNRKENILRNISVLLLLFLSIRMGEWHMYAISTSTTVSFSSFFFYYSLVLLWYCGLLHVHPDPAYPPNWLCPLLEWGVDEECWGGQQQMLVLRYVESRYTVRHAVHHK